MSKEMPIYVGDAHDLRGNPIKVKVEEIAWHRNGIGGEGFYAIRFTSQEREGPVEPMLGIVFGESETMKKKTNGYCAVVNRELAQTTIEFGSNSFRGDVYEEVLRNACTNWTKRQTD